MPESSQESKSQKPTSIKVLEYVNLGLFLLSFPALLYVIFAYYAFCRSAFAGATPGTVW